MRSLAVHDLVGFFMGFFWVPIQFQSASAELIDLGQFLDDFGGSSAVCRGFFRAKCGVHPRFVGRKMDGIRKLSRYGRFMTLLYQHEQELMGISLGSAEQYILFSNGTSTTWGIKWNP